LKVDYIGILKKSWNVTWRYKILWLFGLFAGAGGGGGTFSYSFPGGSSTSSSSSGLPTGASAAQFEAFVQRYAVLIVIVALFFVVLGLLLWMVSVAARGGLIHLVNEAEERRDVHAAAGWHAGFSKWWRVFAVGFLADLPVGFLVIVMLVVLAIGTVGAIATPLTGMLIAWGYGTLAGLKPLDQDLLFIFGALPPAVTNFIFAERYEQEPDKVASIVMIGNAAALFFIPLALALRL